ncbi:hypothetical protein [Ochrobactrum teleogrylli]
MLPNMLSLKTLTSSLPRLTCMTHWKPCALNFVLLTETPNGTYMRQTKESGRVYEPTAGLAVKGKTTLVNAEGRVIMPTFSISSA